MANKVGVQDSMNQKRASTLTSSLPILILSVITFVSELPNFYGEDIINARESFKSGGKLDFWGGISTLFYSSIPDFGFRWQIWLGFAQLFLATTGLLLIFKLNRVDSRKRLIVYVICYFALIFSSQMTRDGLMFSLLIFGFGLLSLSLEKDQKSKLIPLSLFVIVLAMSFRPWLALAIIPLVWLVVINSAHRLPKKWLIFFACLLALLPAAFEITASKALSLKESYPEQQVMMMDLAATYCYTNDLSSGLRAKTGLEILTDAENYPSVACQLFRPDTWLSLTQGGGNESSKDIQTELWLISPGEEEKARELRSTWLNLIISDPISYLQNKILFAGKLIIGSESRNLTVLSKEKTEEKLIAIYRIPYDIAISLHLFSIISIFVIFLVVPVRNFARKITASIELDRTAIAVFLSCFLWLGLSSIAYIGSNGRYMYSLTILVIILLVKNSQGSKTARS
jgi:hypothetical protein